MINTFQKKQQQQQHQQQSKGGEGKHRIGAEASSLHVYIHNANNGHVKQTFKLALETQCDTPEYQYIVLNADGRA